MTATIHYLNPPLREVPTHEIRSVYHGISDASYIFDEEVVRQQSMEKTMIEIHDKLHPPQERTPDRELLLFGVFLCGPASFLFGYLFCMMING